MSGAENHTYLITGATRGIGKDLLTSYLSRPKTTVIAGVRNPSSAAANALSSLPTGQDSALIVVKIDSGSENDASAAVETLKSTHGITKLDCVIANAGIMKSYAPVASVSAGVLKEHVAVNAIGPLMLFQAALPLLRASSEPKYVLLGSSVGSIAGMEKRPVPMGAYGASKAMAHYLVRKIHYENESLIAFAVDPGFVQTETGNEGAKIFGMLEAPVTVQDSVDYLVATIDRATREKTSGHFPTIEGGDFAW